jgi:hypothetical protein
MLENKSLVLKGQTSKPSMRFMGCSELSIDL